MIANPGYDPGSNGATENFMRSHISTVSIGLVALVAFASTSAAQEPFYKGKRLSLMVNYAAGGPTDIEGRLFARHITRHIEGQPSIIVQNIDGAGGLTGTTWR